MVDRGWAEVGTGLEMGAPVGPHLRGPVDRGQAAHDQGALGKAAQQGHGVELAQCQRCGVADGGHARACVKPAPRDGARAGESVQGWSEGPGRGPSLGRGDVAISCSSDLVPVPALSPQPYHPPPARPNPAPSSDPLFPRPPPPSLELIQSRPQGANSPWLRGPGDHLVVFPLYGCSSATRISIPPRPELDLSVSVPGTE